MYSKIGVVHKLHAGWFIKRPPGEFIKWGLFIKFKGLLRGNPIERKNYVFFKFSAYTLWIILAPILDLFKLPFLVLGS